MNPGRAPGLRPPHLTIHASGSRLKGVGSAWQFSNHSLICRVLSALGALGECGLEGSWADVAHSAVLEYEHEGQQLKPQHAQRGGWEGGCRVQKARRQREGKRRHMGRARCNPSDFGTR